MFSAPPLQGQLEPETVGQGLCPRLCFGAQPAEGLVGRWYRESLTALHSRLAAVPASGGLVSRIFNLFVYLDL